MERKQHYLSHEYRPEYLGFDLMDDQGNITLQHRNTTA